jgi:HrpA-like RNA helicase
MLRAISFACQNGNLTAFPSFRHVLTPWAMRMRRYDAGRGIARLQETWVSTANSLQRRGRAGRVQPGECYRLFSRKTAAGLEVRLLGIVS